VRSGTAGKILWKMDPKLDTQDRNRGVALWNNLVISVTGYATRVIATDKDSGQIVWDKNLFDQEDLELTAAPLALKDAIIVGGSGGDRGSVTVAALTPRPANLPEDSASIRALGEPGSEPEGQSQRLRDRRQPFTVMAQTNPRTTNLLGPGFCLRFQLPPRRQLVWHRVERHRLRWQAGADHVAFPVHAEHNRLRRPGAHI
jgi:hypothetical protein